MKKKIAIIENHIIATNTIRYKLTSVLAEKGYDLRILTTGSDKELKQARDNGFHITDVQSSNKNPFDVIRYIFRLRSELKKYKPDVCLTFTIRPAIWGNLVTSGLHIPTITNITGTGPLFSSNHPVYKLARRLYKYVLKKTARIFFQNNDDMAMFLKHGFVRPEKAERIPGSGIDHEYFYPRPFPENKKSFTCLFIGRLVKDKGIVEYVNAARKLKMLFPETRCLILGPLWLQNLKENIITKKELDQWEAEGIIEYLGETADVRPFIAAADCIVLPSYREGTSNVLLEAAAMERPGITCNTTGCREIVEDGKTGLLCNVADAGDLAAKMIMMHERSETDRQAMGKAAREKVIKEFDKRIVIDAYINAIESI